MEILSGNNLMIVAHPDDEVLFGYSQLRRPGRGCWTVLCLTNVNNTQRREEFVKIMNTLPTIDYCILDHPDIWEGSFNKEQVSQNIKYSLSRSNFDNVLTHNAVGEYGHSQHKALHQIVSSVISKNLYVFKESNTILPFDILKEKLEILSIYKSQKDLGLYEWNNSQLMKYVISEGIEKVK